MTDCWLLPLEGDYRGLCKRGETQTLQGIPGEDSDVRFACIADGVMEHFKPHIRRIADEVKGEGGNIVAVQTRKRREITRLMGHVPISTGSRMYASALGRALISLQWEGGPQAVGLNAALLGFRSRFHNGDYNVGNVLKELGMVKE
jgi:hypothetical protein